VSDAYEKCLGWANQFMSNAEYEMVYTINTDFFPANVDASTITAWISGIQSGILPPSALYSQMRDANITQLSDEDIAEEIEASSNGLNLGDG
jgi:hypothetical protein